jgi:diacylglycerol kinase family enzyme
VRRRYRPPRRKAALETSPATPPEAASRQDRFYVILNDRAGTALAQGLTPDRVRESFTQCGHTAIVDGSGDDLNARVDRALASDAGVVVSAGGDGTATLVAHRLIGTGKSLAVLPLGTANLLARDLGVPLDVDAAIDALKAAEVRQIDVGEVNGRVFLHQVVVGTFPAMAAVREKIRARADLAGLAGFARHLVRGLARSRRIAVAIAPRGGAQRIVRVYAIAVANNAYDEGWAQVFRRSRLDAGCLTLYSLSALSIGDALRLVAKMLAGRWRDDPAVDIESVHAVTLDARRRALRVMIDGELELLTPPLRFRIRPGALAVLAPAVAKAGPV